MDRKESGEGRMNQQKNPPRVAVVGTGSGCGKTTVVCALLQAFCNRGLKATSFKCGPDYIDPMFHQKVIGTPSRNLDLFFCGEDTVRYLFCRAAADAEISVIEGVMGMYDGIGPDTQEASSNHLAMVTKTPEILVVNTRGMSLSAAALLSGYAQFAPNQLAGVIFNGSSAGMYPSYAKMAQSLGLQPLGYFPVVPQASVESRHLGLVTAGEIENLKEKMMLLAETAEKTLDLDGILQLAQSTVTLEYKKPSLPPLQQVSVRIGVALDEAFCFYYADSLRLLERLGAEQIDSVLLEGGGTLNWSMLEAGLVQRVQAYIAPKLLGGAGARSPVEGRGVEAPDQAAHLRKVTVTALGEDFLLEGEGDRDVYGTH